MDLFKIKFISPKKTSALHICNSDNKQKPSDTKNSSEIQEPQEDSNITSKLKGFNTTSKKVKNNKERNNDNFLKALELLKNSSKAPSVNENLSEFSGINTSTSKDVKVQKYLNNPLNKTIVKKGNNLVKLTSIANSSQSVKFPLTFNNVLQNLMSKDIEIDDEGEKDTQRERNGNIKDNIGINIVNNDISSTNYSHKEVKGGNELEIIDDLDENKEVIIDDYCTNGKIKNVLIQEKNSVDKDIDIDDNYKTNEIVEFNREGSKIYIIDSLMDNDFFCKNIDNSSSVSEICNRERLFDGIRRKIFADEDNQLRIKMELKSDKDSNKDESQNQSKDDLFHTPLSKIIPFSFYPDNRKVDQWYIANHKPTKSNNFRQKSIIHQYTKSNVSVSSILSNSRIGQDINFKTPNNNNSSEFNDEGVVFDDKFLNNLINHNLKYTIRKDYMSKFKIINWKERAKLINWLMELSEQFAFKRDTFHLCVFNLDLFMSKAKQCKTINDFYLNGVCSLGIAAKIEEVKIPPLSEYIMSLNEVKKTKFEVSHFIKKEIEMLMAFQWKALPNTINTWLCWHISQWDLFIDTFPQMKGLLLESYNEDQIVYFKKKDDISYYNYRRIAQLVDLYVLDHNYFNYNMQYLAVGAILIVLWMSYEKDILNYKKLLQSNKVYFKVYKEFIKLSLGEGVLNSKEFNNTIDFCAKHKGIKFKFDLPLIYQFQENEMEKGSFEDFITYQTYNEGCIDFILKKDFNK